MTACITCPFAEITLHGGDDAGASHLVLLIVQGSLGGSRPTVSYLPSPFAPKQ